MRVRYGQRWSIQPPHALDPGDMAAECAKTESNDGYSPADEYSIDDYYSKMEPRGAVLMVCDDIASALGEAPNGSA